MNIEREKLFIGCLLLDNEKIADTEITADMLIDGRAVKIFEAAVKLYNKGIAVDLISLNDDLRNHDLLQYALEASKSVHSAEMIKLYEKEIHDNFIYSKVIKKLNLICKMTDIEQIAENIEDVMRDIKVTSNDVVDVSTAMKSFINELIESKIGIKMPFAGLAEYIEFLEPGRIYIIGGRPSDGKSALLLSLLNKLDCTCGLVSIETTAHEICARLLSMKSKVTTGQIKTNLNAVQKRIMLESAELINKNKLIIYDKTGNLNKAKQAMRQMVDKCCKVIGIDYMQLLRLNESKRSKVEDLAIISNELKEFAKKHNVVLLVAAQLGRDADDGGAVKLSQLQWSSQLEQDADVVLMIRHKRNETREIQESTIIVAKNRDGATGVVKMNFACAYTLWVDDGVGVV